MKIKSIQNKDVYNGIVKILEKNGFEKVNGGDMVRRKTGCHFDYKTLISYESVMDFQMEWHYS